MIFIVPILIFVISLIVCLVLAKTESYVIILPVLLLIVSFFALFVITMKFLLSYNDYINNKSIVAYCQESITEKSKEFQETIAVNQDDKIYQNKFSEHASFASNLDKPIEATQEYLKELQLSRLKEREKCLEAKREVLSFKMGFFGFAQ